MEPSVEYDFGYAIVRVQPGKRSEEERRKVLEDAAKDFWKALQKAEAAKGKTLTVDSDGRIVSVSKCGNGLGCGSVQRNAGCQG